MVQVLIFTEGSQEIGLGHLSRCSALYDELVKLGHEVCFIVNGDQSAVAFLGKRNIIINYWYGKLAQFTDIHNNYCIVDSYMATIDDYNYLSQQAKRCLYIDDNNRLKYPQGVILNFSGTFKTDAYTDQDNVKILNGIEYAILRKPFRNEFGRKANDKISNVLIIFGATDIANMTEVAINTVLDNLNNVSIHVVGNDTQVSKEAIGNSKLFFYKNLSAQEVCQLMLRCDIAISAAGQTIFELIACRLPFAAIKIADNQDDNINMLLANGLIQDYAKISPQMSHELKSDFVSRQFKFIMPITARTTFIESASNYVMTNAISKILQQFFL